MFNQCYNYYFFIDAITNMINLSVKLTQKRLDLEDQIIYIPQASFDVKLLMVANRK